MESEKSIKPLQSSLASALEWPGSESRLRWMVRSLMATRVAEATAQDLVVMLLDYGMTLGDLIAALEHAIGPDEGAASARILDGLAIVDEDDVYALLHDSSARRACEACNQGVPACLDLMVAELGWSAAELRNELLSSGAAKHVNKE